MIIIEIMKYLGIVFLIMLVIALIILVFNVTETLIYTKFQEWEQRRFYKNQLKRTMDSVSKHIEKEIEKQFK